MRRLPILVLATALASCVPSSPRPAEPAPPKPVPALPAAPPQQDWRDVPLTPGTWTWQGAPGTMSVARFGVPGAATAFTVRCDPATRMVALSGRSSDPATIPEAGTMTVTTSFGAFTLPASGGAARLAARDPRLDRIAFSRGRFLVDQPGRPRLVLPAWPEVARVIEDCRG